MTPYSRWLMYAMIVALATVSSCEPGTSHVAELVDTITYAPYQFSIAARKKCADISLQQLQPDNSGMQRVTLEYVIRRLGQHMPSTRDVIFDGLSSNEEYTIRLRDIALRLHQDVTMDIGSETVECIGSMMEYDVGLSDRKRIYLAFDVPCKMLERAETAIVRIKDRHFGAGLMTFVLDPGTMVHEQ